MLNGGFEYNWDPSLSISIVVEWEISLMLWVFLQGEAGCLDRTFSLSAAVAPFELQRVKLQPADANAC